MPVHVLAHALLIGSSGLLIVRQSASMVLRPSLDAQTCSTRRSYGAQQTSRTGGHKIQRAAVRQQRRTTGVASRHARLINSDCTLRSEPFDKRVQCGDRDPATPTDGYAR